MKWALVLMCTNMATSQPAWCPPIQLFDKKDDCVEVKDDLMKTQPSADSFWHSRSEYACVPSPTPKAGEE